MDIFALPVINGVLPRPRGGVLTGFFIDPYFSKMITLAGKGGEVFLFPYSKDDDTFYPVGIIAVIEDIWAKEMIAGQKKYGLLVKIIGQERGKAKGFDLTSEGIVAKGVEKLNFYKLRSGGFPVICGAGWQPQGGYTTFGSDKKSINITIYGFDYESGKRVSITADLKGLVEAEKAHTIEHGIIRSLKNYGLCTAKTLRNAMQRETQELKWSIEIGMAHRLPEFFGITDSGICGNPLTYLASTYLNEEIIKNLKAGENFFDSLELARSKTISRLAQDMEISTNREYRALQGLKKGMKHDDTYEEMEKLKRILNRFPITPWD